MKIEKETQNYKDIQEPENFYIMSTNDDLTLTSKEAVEDLLNDLENVEYDEKLSEFYSTLKNQIKDLTKK